MIKKILVTLLFISIMQSLIAQSADTGIIGEYANELPLSTSIILRDEIKEVTEKYTEREKKAIYINFGAKYPKNTFALIINEENFSKFSKIFELINKDVEVEGSIESYLFHNPDGSYSKAKCIILTNQNQLHF